MRLMRRSRPSHRPSAADQGLLLFPEAESVAGLEPTPPTPVAAMVVPRTVGPAEATVDDPGSAPACRILMGSSTGIDQVAAISVPCLSVTAWLRLLPLLQALRSTADDRVRAG